MVNKYLLLSLLLVATLQAEGILLVTPSFSNFTCLKASHKDLVVIRALLPTGTIDSTAPNNIKLANQAGFLTDVAMYPCVGKNATSQVNEMIEYLDKQLSKKQRLLFEIKEEEFDQLSSESIYDKVYGTIWLSVVTNSALGCSWSSKSTSQNCAYIGELVSAIQNKGKSAGIISGNNYWKQILGDPSACSNFKSLPVMYSNLGSDASFSDWIPFGGWTSPNLKYYNSEEVICGARLGLIYF